MGRPLAAVGRKRQFVDLSGGQGRRLLNSLKKSANTRRWAVFGLTCAVCLGTLLLGVAPESWSQSSSVLNAPVTDGLSPANPNNPATYLNTSFKQDPTDPEHLVIAFGEGHRRTVCGLAQSHDGGRSWSSKILVGRAGEQATFQLPVPGPVANSAICHVFDKPTQGTPEVAFDSQGTLYYLFTAGRALTAGGYATTFIIKSTDGGEVFDGPVQQVDPLKPVSMSDWDPYLFVNPVNRRVNVLSRRFCAPCTKPDWAGIFMTSADPTPEQAPLSFSAAVKVALLTGADDGEPLASFSRNGKDLNVMWQDHAAYTASGGAAPVLLKSITSIDGGPFGIPSVVAPIGNACPYVPGPCDAPHYDEVNEPMFSVATGDSPGEIHVAWWDHPVPGDPNRISFSTSKDSGRVWSVPTMLPLRVGAGVDEQQHRPWISLSPKGRLDLAYYALSQGPAYGQDVYVASSCDDGSHFSDQRRLTTQSSNAVVGAKALVANPPSTVYTNSSEIASQGRVMGVSTDDGFLAGWTDSRLDPTGSRNTVGGRQDVFFGRIDSISPCAGLEPPSITQLIPNRGLTTGGEKVTILGTKLNAASAVKFDQTSLICPGPNCTVVADTKIEVLTPPHPQGSAPVSVGVGATSTNILPFEYLAPAAETSPPPPPATSPAEPPVSKPDTPIGSGAVQAAPKPPAPPAPPGGTSASTPASSGAPNSLPAPGSVPGPAAGPIASSVPGPSTSSAFAPSGQTTVAGAPGVAGHLNERAIGAPNTAYNMTGRSQDPVGKLLIAASILGMGASCLIVGRRGLIAASTGERGIHTDRPQPQSAY